MSLYGAVELGGTNTRLMVVDESSRIIQKAAFQTQDPTTTIKKITRFFQSAQSERGQRIQTIGAACFGPLDLSPTSQTFGQITTTPKPGWQFFNFKEELEKRLGVNVFIDSDVNAAALAEFNHLSAKSRITDLAYITVGTGIGAGLIIDSRIVHGLSHPEFGHIRIPHDFKNDPFPGICPYHQDCLEGLASGPAIQARWGQTPATIPAGHVAWVLEAAYLSTAVVNLICTVSPQLILIGGGVMNQSQLYPQIRNNVQNLLNRYINSDRIIDEIDDYIAPPAISPEAGLAGALLLAKAGRQK